MSIKSIFQDIADAIKEKYTSISSLTPSQMPDAIRNIQSGAELILRSEWNSKSISEKRSYNYVGVIDNDSGYVRGELVYGADYNIISIKQLYDNGGEITYTINDNVITLTFTNVGSIGGVILYCDEIYTSFSINITNNSNTVQWGNCKSNATLPTVITNGTNRGSYYTNTSGTVNYSSNYPYIFMGIYNGGSYTATITFNT